MNDLDHAVALQLGEGAADGLDGQAEIVGDVLAAHRKRNRVRYPLQRDQPLAPAEQKGRNLFVRRTAAEQDHVVPGLVQLANRQFVDPPEEVQPVLDETAEGCLRELAYGHRADRIAEKLYLPEIFIPTKSPGK